MLFIGLVLAPGCDRGAHPGLIGGPAPDFRISDGLTSIHLADYRGRIVLLNFWFSSCAPCFQETPALIHLHHDRPDLAVLAVSVDGDPEAYTRFLSRFHVDLITVRDPEQSVANLYQTKIFPETYIIDRRGIVRRKSGHWLRSLRYFSRECSK